MQKILVFFIVVAIGIGLWIIWPQDVEIRSEKGEFQESSSIKSSNNIDNNIKNIKINISSSQAKSEKKETEKLYLSKQVKYYRKYPRSGYEIYLIDENDANKDVDLASGYRKAEIYLGNTKLSIKVPIKSIGSDQLKILIRKGKRKIELEAEFLNELATLSLDEVLIVRLREDGSLYATSVQSYGNILPAPSPH